MSTDKDYINRERFDIEWVTSTEQGRRFLWRVLSHCGIYQDFGGSSEEMLKQIGKRQVGLFLLGIISDASEDKVFTMMKEAKNRSIEEKEDYDRANQDNSRTINTVDGIIDTLPGYSTDPGPVF